MKIVGAVLDNAECASYAQGRIVSLLGLVVESVVNNCFTDK